MTSLPPGLLLILGALVIPLLRRPKAPYRQQGRWQASWVLLLAALGLAHMLTLEAGTTWGQLEIFGYQLTLVRVDALSLAFGYIFHIAAFLAALYSLHVRDGIQHAAGLVYVGSAVGAVFAGDLITLFVYWEITAVSSVFLIWARRRERSYRAGMRYLIVQGRFRRAAPVRPAPAPA